MILNGNLITVIKIFIIFFILTTVHKPTIACDLPNYEDRNHDIKSRLLVNYELNISLTNKDIADVEIMRSTFSENYIKYSFSRNGKEIKLLGVSPMQNYSGLFVTLGPGEMYSRNIKLLDRFRSLNNELKKGDVKLTWTGSVLFRNGSLNGGGSISKYRIAQSVNLPSL